MGAHLKNALRPSKMSFGFFILPGPGLALLSVPLNFNYEQDPTTALLFIFLKATNPYQSHA